MIIQLGIFTCSSLAHFASSVVQDLASVDAIPDAAHKFCVDILSVSA